MNISCKEKQKQTQTQTQMQNTNTNQHTHTNTNQQIHSRIQTPKHLNPLSPQKDTKTHKPSHANTDR